jgi:hypothetical protein
MCDPHLRSERSPHLGGQGQVEPEERLLKQKGDCGPRIALIEFKS